MAQRPAQPKNKNGFKVAIICALPVEAGMVRSAFDGEWNMNRPIEKAQGDHNTYTLGAIGQHNVVLVHMPGMGAVDAATTTAGVRVTFPSVQIAFLVGICGASPVNATTGQEVCLGDCIISTGVVQYDFGRQYPGHFSRKTDGDSLGRAGPMIRSLLAKLQTPGTSLALETRLAQHLRLLQEKELEARHPGIGRDRLFMPTYLHIHRDTNGTCDKCAESGVCTMDCSEIGCEERQSVPRARFSPDTSLTQSLPRLHFGRYGSANTVLKSGEDRDKHTQNDQIVAFEMEAAGVWENIPTLVIKSACDYADSHKNKAWQRYAAATAAAGLKAVMEELEVIKIVREESEVIGSVANYNIPFNLDKVPLAKKFVDRPKEMQKLEEVLLAGQSDRRRIFVLRGLGGTGKTQLAVRFMRKHHGKFSAIFWLDGSSEDSLKQSIARHAGTIPAGQISDRSRMYTTTGEGNIDVVVTEMMEWLKKYDNTGWLLVFDNVDREFDPSRPKPLSYDINNYVPTADHGAILVSTRLGQLERLGESQDVGRVDNETAKAILQTWHSSEYSGADVETLLGLLDGLPLAIAQAGAYLHQKAISISTYLELYHKQEKKVAEALHESETLLGDYNRSLWTTWSVSYDAVCMKNKYAANLLIFWSFIDRNDVWYGLLERAADGGSGDWSSDWSVREALSRYLGDIASQKISFVNAMGLLRDYSLIEGTGDTGGYVIHTLVHRWLYFHYGMKHRLGLGLLALRVVGLAIPLQNERDCFRMQRRLLPHANMCLLRVIDDDEVTSRIGGSGDEIQVDRAEQEYCLQAIDKFGLLYAEQNKLAEAERMWARALAGREAVLGAEHTTTLNTVNNLGLIYYGQNKLAEAEQMYVRALAGKEAALGAEHASTLNTVHNLGLLYKQRGKLVEAERMYVRALAGTEVALGAGDPDTLLTAYNLGSLYLAQGKLVAAEQMLVRALTGYEAAFDTEIMTHVPALNTMLRLGELYSKTRPKESRDMYERALAGFTGMQGASYDTCVAIRERLRALDINAEPEIAANSSKPSASAERNYNPETSQPAKGLSKFKKMLRRMLKHHQ